MAGRPRPAWRAGGRCARVLGRPDQGRPGAATGAPRRPPGRRPVGGQGLPQAHRAAPRRDRDSRTKPANHSGIGGRGPRKTHTRREVMTTPKNLHPRTGDPTEPPTPPPTRPPIPLVPPAAAPAPAALP